MTPHPIRFAWRSFTLRLLLVFALFACARGARAEEPLMHVRIAWGDGPAATWRGSIAVDQGAITSAKPLGVEADEPGSMWIRDGRVEIAAKSGRVYDGVDVAVTAPLSAKLQIRLAKADAAAEAPLIEFALASLVEKHQIQKLDNQGNRLVVRRTPGDRLRVRLDRPDLVLAPQEALRFELVPALFGGELPEQIQLRTLIRTARGDQSWLDSEQTIVAPPADRPGEAIPIEIEVPRREGVYDLVISASLPQRRRGIAQVNPLAQPSPSLAERRVQFLVLDGQSPRTDEDAEVPSVVVDEIRRGTEWWERVAELPQIAELPRIASINRNPTKHGQARSFQHPQFGELSEIGPRKDDQQESWIAYPLEIKQSGEVHILEVEYPIDAAQHLAVTILEPNAAGAVEPISLDSGVSVPPQASGDRNRLAVHRLIFWPRTRTPVVLLSNPSRIHAARFGALRVLGPRPFEVGGLRLAGAARSRLPKAPGLTGQNERLVAAYLSEPLLPENFSASEAFDSWSRRSLDDWVTFYEGGTRLAEYLQHVGYNAVVIPALHGGSALYPSDLVEPTPRYDTGTFFTNGQDPVRKDVVEMLLRIGDRENLQVVLALDLSAPLPALEELLRQEGAASGIRLIGPDGRTWSETFGAPQGRAAYYNPLDSRVQRAIKDVVRELVARYREHASFAGLMISSGSPSYGLLPGELWGVDDVTVQRFSQASGIAVPQQGVDRFAARAELLGNRRRDAWLAWRSRQIEAFLAELRGELAALGPQAKLLVATDGMVTNPSVAQTLRPGLPNRAAPGDLPEALGIDPGTFRDGEGIVLLRPHAVSPTNSLSGTSLARQLNFSPQLASAFAARNESGRLFLHAAQRRRLRSFDERGPFGQERTYTSLTTQLTPTGPHNRRRIIESLADRDERLLIDGGTFLAFGQEDAVRDIFTAYRRLPAVEFETLSTEQQSIVVLRAVHDGFTYVYVLNNSPAPATVRLAVGNGQGVAGEDLRQESPTPADLGSDFEVRLAAYDLAAYRLGAADVAIAPSAVQLSPQLHAKLATRIQELSDRATALGNPQQVPLLENAGFEVGQQPGVVTGWNFQGGAGSVAQLDAAASRAGQTSVRLTSTGNLALLVSDKFRSPPTGRLVFSAWLRVAPGEAVPDLRLAIGGRTENGEDYYRFGRINGLNQFEGGQWQQIQFGVDDLPWDGLSDCQIRFDLMGAGQVWIDDVEIFPLQFTNAERIHLSRLLADAETLLKAQRYTDCIRLLDGFWPHYLEQHVSLATPRVAQQGRPQLRNKGAAARRQPPPPAQQQEEEEESWWQRRLPSFLK
ncbi:MAG: hypothetical protein DWQ31_00935 [Planctomycetota bacterium]|nr:MAG: hypothetical protein DWQ31_00935 [Planctomycetota bacterium]